MFFLKKFVYLTLLILLASLLHITSSFYYFTIFFFFKTNASIHSFIQGHGVQVQSLQSWR